MSRGTVAVGVLMLAVILQPRLPAQAPVAVRSIDIQSFTIEGSIDFADHRQPRRGVFQIWYQAPDKYVRRERITDVQSDGFRAGQPAEIESTTLGFNGQFVIFDGTWPGPPEFEGRYSSSVGRIPTQADLSVLLPAAHADVQRLSENRIAGGAISGGAPPQPARDLPLKRGGPTSSN